MVFAKPTSWGAGLGLFVKEDLVENSFPGLLVKIHKVLCIRPGVFLTTYGGLLCYIEDWKKQKLQAEGLPEDRWCYAFQIHPLFLLDAFDYPAKGTDMAHFANHTTQLKCNAKLKVYFPGGHFLPGICTVKAIPLGSEVLVHYSKYFDTFFPILPSADSISSSTSDEDFCLL